MPEETPAIPQGATLTWPKTTTRKVWVGAYGGHYEAVVIFLEEPTFTKDIDLIEEEWLREEEEANPTPPYVDLNKNKGKIAGCIWGSDFEELFGFEVRAASTEIIEVFPVALTAPFDKNGRLTSVVFDRDGY